MKSYTLALIVSVGVFLAGIVLGYTLLAISGLNPKVVLGVVMEATPAKATVARVEAVSQAVEVVAEAVVEAVDGPPPAEAAERLNLWGVDFKMVSIALGILATNTVTAFGAAVTPLLPVLWQRRITPWFMRVFRKSYDPVESWRNYFRYIVPLPPVLILGFNGFVVGLITSIVGFIDFMAPEIAGITCLTAVGMKAALNSSTPESVENSYNDIWRAAFYSTLFLTVGAFMEARLIV